MHSVRLRQIAGMTSFESVRFSKIEFVSIKKKTPGRSRPGVGIQQSSVEHQPQFASRITDQFRQLRRRR
jgi:hypothetical protein